jgi:GNAT superfamily N-acetyltransferase
MFLSTLALLSLRLARLTSNEAPAIASLLHNQFPLNGQYSWARAVGLKSSNLENYLLADYLPKIFQADSYIGCYGVFTDEKNSLVGAIINENLNFNPENNDDVNGNLDPLIEGTPQYNDDVNGNSDPLIEGTPQYAYAAFDAILSSSKQMFLERMRHSNIKIDGVNYVGWIATTDLYKKKGIAGQLIQETAKQLRNKGYKYSVAFTVSPAATKVFRANGYEVWGEIEYKSFKMKQFYPFRSLPDSLSIMVQNLQ